MDKRKTSIEVPTLAHFAIWLLLFPINRTAPAPKIGNQIKILSNALNSPHQVAKIKNRTSDFLIEEASANIGLAAQCLSLTGSDGGLGDILQQAIENMANGNPGESNGNYFDCGGDPSRN